MSSALWRINSLKWQQNRHPQPFCLWILSSPVCILFLARRCVTWPHFHFVLLNRLWRHKICLPPPPAAASDHNAQLFWLRVDNSPPFALRKWAPVNFQHVCNSLNSVHWRLLLNSCYDIDNHASRFTSSLANLLATSAIYKRVFRRPRMPLHVVHLLRKMKKWLEAKRI